jgi:hypothetical protein
MLAIKPSQVAGDTLERKGECEGIRKTSRSCCLGYMDRGKSFSNQFGSTKVFITLFYVLQYYTINVIIFLALSRRKALHRASI